MPGMKGPRAVWISLAGKLEGLGPPGCASHWRGYRDVSWRWEVEETGKHAR